MATTRGRGASSSELPQDIHARLQSAGAAYYVWSSEHPAGTTDTRQTVLVRLVTSFATTEQEVAQFIATIRAC